MKFDKGFTLFCDNYSCMQESKISQRCVIHFRDSNNNFSDNYSVSFIQNNALYSLCLSRSPNITVYKYKYADNNDYYCSRILSMENIKIPIFIKDPIKNQAIDILNRLMKLKAFI